MKSTQLTQGSSYLILAVYLLYAMFALPFAGFVLSLAAGMMTYGGTESVEISVAITLFAGILYSLITKSAQAQVYQIVNTGLGATQTREGFMGAGGSGSGADAVGISKRVERIYKASTSGPAGVFASPFVEGFADATAGTGAGSTAVPAVPATNSTNSLPASTTTEGAGSGIPPAAPPTTMTMPAVVPSVAASPDTRMAARGKPVELPAAAASPAEPKPVSGFQSGPDRGSVGQFKLGVMPSEKEDASSEYHIDMGTTVLNALNALKPDQVKAMSEDTQRLIDTQKSLMSMLSTMKPMLTDGKQMMDTFQQMFGGSGAAGKGFSIGA